MNKNLASEPGGHNSRTGIRILIVFMPAIIIVTWFIFLNTPLSVTLYELDPMIRVLIPVFLATILVVVARIFYPIKISVAPLIRAMIPTILVYPLVCLIILILSDSGPNGKNALIYFFAIGSFWATVGVTFATLLGSYFGRLSGKTTV
ncbi:MAG TPA: hypothetical protein VLE49_18390 [Anaerolineales bacterium]|nr:hypothetical protein [Anaerolineales bacterium]